MMVEVYLGWPGESQEWKEQKRNYYCCGPMGKSERYSRYKSEFEISKYLVSVNLLKTEQKEIRNLQKQELFQSHLLNCLLLCLGWLQRK